MEGVIEIVLRNFKEMDEAQLKKLKSSKELQVSDDKWRMENGDVFVKIDEMCS